MTHGSTLHTYIKFATSTRCKLTHTLSITHSKTRRETSNLFPNTQVVPTRFCRIPDNAYEPPEKENSLEHRGKPSNHHHGRSPKTRTALASRRTSLRKNQLSTYDKNATTNTTHHTRTRVSDITAKRKKTSYRAPSQRRASVIPTCLTWNYTRNATEDETCLPTSVVS